MHFSSSCRKWRNTDQLLAINQITCFMKEPFSWTALLRFESQLFDTFISQHKGDFMETSYNFCNRIYHGCGIAGMRLLDADSIPLVVTSPPYGSIRDYGGHSFYFKPMARELWRVVMSGGVVCWHVHDQIKAGAESGESIRQAVYFLDLGFDIHTTLVIEGSQISKYRNRYPGFQLMLHLDKLPRANSLEVPLNRFIPSKFIREWIIWPIRRIRPSKVE